MVVTLLLKPILGSVHVLEPPSPSPAHTMPIKYMNISFIGG